MSKRKQPGKGGSRNKPRHLRAVPDARGDGPGDQPLIAMLRPSLRSDDPIDFLATVSTLVESVRPPRGPSFAMSSFGERERPTLEMLVESFIGTSIRETTAALYVIREFIADEVMAARIDRELAQRRQPVPPWIRSLRDTRVTRIVRTVEELGDGENMAIGFQIPDAKPLALIAFIDHNLLSSVKDAFPYPGSIDDFVGYFDSLANADGENIRFEELPDRAIARAAVDRALDRTDMVFPSVTSESWPQCRPWLEWLLRLLPGMPAGMSLYEEEWDHSAIDDLVDGFLRAPEAKSLKYKDTGDMVETLAWLNSADPTRWSPVVVEILLEDRLPRKVIDSPKNLASYPDVLRAFVRYCHRMSEVTSRSTADTLRSIDRSEPRFRQLISGKATSDHPTAAVSAYLRDAIADGVDPADVMNSIIGRDIDELDYQAERDTTRSPAVIEALRKIGQMTLDDLARAVGDAEKLRGLTADPLPDEQFDWSGISQEIRGPVGEVLALCDDAADAHLDYEYRTAMRRLLAKSARIDPSIFASKTSTERTAAAVVWAITRGNNTRSFNDGTKFTATALLARLGVKSSVAQRGEPFLRAVGAGAPHDYAQGVLSLKSARFLTSMRRRQIVAARDRAQENAAR